jgi:tetratricopeptide (TPR) repeat protein
VGVGAQRPPPPYALETQERLKTLAQRSAQELADRVKATTAGALGAEANLAIRRWDAAIQAWKREKDSGAAPLLAEGVLFDCLSRLQGVKTRLVSTEVSVPYFADLAAKRPGRAVKSFDAALRTDPDLVEARMRAARIRARSDPNAVRELERLAESQTGTPFAYLAAIARAEVASQQDDAAAAIRWYERALVIHPRSVAATIALGVLMPARARSFAALDSADLYYRYPCVVLTASVDAALAERLQAVVSR